MYDAAVTVELKETIAGAETYYTLDGTMPGPDNGSLYTEPLEVPADQGTRVLRAISVLPGGGLSLVATHSYVFPAVMLDQPFRPEGFPEEWGTRFDDLGNGTVVDGDYEMRPSVLADDAARAEAVAGLKAIPMVALTLDMDDLWGDERGIYRHPEGPETQPELDWERPVQVEFFPQDGTEGFSVRCGVRVQGGSSTRNWKSEKISMRLFFRALYGPTKLNYKLFEDTEVSEFNTVILDAHLNYTWNAHRYSEQIRSQYTRDQYVSDMMHRVGTDAPHHRYVHLVLNGLYWGIYDIHERPDEDFAASYLGGDATEWDVIRHVNLALAEPGDDPWSVVAGNDIAWREMFTLARAGLADDTNYQAIQGYLDLDHFIDYVLVNFFVGNTDWSHHNWYAARHRSEGAGYRFFSWDAEIVLLDVNVDVTTKNDSDSPTELYQHLLANPDFKARVAARAAELFAAGGPFYVDTLNPSYDPAAPERNRPAALYVERATTVMETLILEEARWGDNRYDTGWGVPNWQSEYNSLMQSYFPMRSSIVKAQLDAQLAP